MPETQTIFDAIKAGDTAAVTALLEADPGLAAARDATGTSAVTFAAYHRRADALALLLARAPELDAFEAVIVGDEDRLRALLDADPSLLHAYSGDGTTLLHFAAFFRHAPIVRLLLERGADARARTRNAMANTPLHAALAGHLSVEDVRLLLDAGADVNDRQHGGYTALHSAAMHGDDEMVSLLLDRGADPALPADDGKTAADFARTAGHATLADRLAGQAAPG
ncbi:MAG TPA: ankyrin repeat domain-containing protein [Longimicrobiaceae bacterium]|nr:ankyrin repeat domain-containing protein [Longimicrobiaceae bacterium]